MLDYLIVGAGISGLVFAREMMRAGRKVLVVEKRDRIGGNIVSDYISGIEVHKYGPHIFHTSKDDIWSYVNQFSEFRHFTNSPIANYYGETYCLPFNMNTFSKLYGVDTPEEAKRCIEADKRFFANPSNAEELALSTVGETIYEKLIKGYTEKQWGRKCTDLSPDILKRIPLRFTYDNDYFNDKYSGIPKDGYNKFIESLAKDVPVMCGIDFCKNKDIKNIAKKVVYTGAIDELYGRAIGLLEYRSLKFKTEVVDIDNYQGVAVMNYTGSDVPYTRIVEHKHFNRNNQIIGKTVITFEYPQSFGIGMNGEERFYPVERDDNRKMYQRYKEIADKDGIILLGRLAEYEYYDMDEAIERALELVANELAREGK